MSKLVTVFLILILLIAGPILLLRRLSSHSTLAFDPPPKAIGVDTPFSIHVTNPHGVRRIAAVIEQGGARVTVSEIAKPANRLTFWRAHLPAGDFHFIAGKNQDANLKEGKARLIVEAQSNDLRASTDAVSTDVDVIFHPPSVAADGFQHYINQGGSELAILTPSGSFSEAGVRVGGQTFRSFPLPGSPDQRFALFAYAWDTPRGAVPMVYVKNAAGAESTAPFWFKIFPKKFRARDLAIDDKFLEKVVNQIDPGGSGDLLTRFLKINGEMRRANNQTLADLRLKTEEKFLWTAAVSANGQFESRIVIRRRPQLHLQRQEGGSAGAPGLRPRGYRSTRRCSRPTTGRSCGPRRSAFTGTASWSITDYGLQSIYGHLSEIGVKEGEMVKRGQEMGKSGSTGLAGGDHLHFSMQVDGVQVNPIEWWDQHWINDHIFNRIPHP